KYSRRHFRHELASALALRVFDGATDAYANADALVLYLVGAHHGRVRLTIRPAPEEERPHGCREGTRFALGVADGDELPAVEPPVGLVPAVVRDLGCMELGPGSWTEQACRLRDDLQLGPFRLAFRWLAETPAETLEDAAIIVAYFGALGGSTHAAAIATLRGF